MKGPIPPLKTLLWRGMQQKCPHCGQGRLFQRWNKLNSHCQACGLKLLENEGDLWGYLIIGDRALFILPLIVMIYFRLYNPSSPLFFIFSGGLLVGLIYTLPHRTGVSLALDYLMRRKSSDLAAAPTDGPD